MYATALLDTPVYRQLTTQEIDAVVGGEWERVPGSSGLSSDVNDSLWLGEWDQTWSVYQYAMNDGQIWHIETNLVEGYLYAKAVQGC